MDTTPLTRIVDGIETAYQAFVQLVTVVYTTPALVHMVLLVAVSVAVLALILRSIADDGRSPR